jgi:hypothetical protein
MISIMGIWRENTRNENSWPTEQPQEAMSEKNVKASKSAFLDF